MVHSRYYEDTYSEEDLARLCEHGGLFPEDMSKLRKDLEDFAAVYRWENARFQDLPSYKEVSAELIRIQKQAARLLNSLENVGWDAQCALEKGMDADSMEMITLGKAAPEYPSLFLSLRSISESVMGVTLDIPALKAILGGLEIAASNGQQNLGKRPSKKIPDYGLRLWLVNIELLWRKLSEHPFSRDVDSRGEPITYAGQFCVAAFKMIEPNYSVSRVMNGMKNLKKEQRQSTGKAGEEIAP